MWKWKMDPVNLTNFLSDWKAFYKNNSGPKKDFEFYLIILYSSLSGIFIQLKKRVIAQYNLQTNNG